MSGSTLQPDADKDIRGDDFDDPEYLRATAYKTHVETMSKGAARNLALLKGDPVAYRNLQHKTLPLTRSAPPYIDSP